MDTNSLSLKQKIWNFSDSPWTWGGIGVIVGAVAGTVPLGLLFAIGGVIIAVGLIRAKMFEGHARLIKVGGNTFLCVLLALILIGARKLIPKAKECPSLEDIQKAFKDAPQRQEVAQIPAGTQQRPLKPSISYHKAKPTLPPNEKPKEHLPASRQGVFQITQTAQQSTRADARYETKVVIQTTMEFPTLNLAMECDKPLIDAEPQGPGGGMMNVRWGISKDHPNIFVFSYGSSVPPFGPANPLVINVWSKDSMKCNSVATF